MSGLLEKDICLLLRGHRNMLILFFMICVFLGLGQPGTFILGYLPSLMLVVLIGTFSCDESDNGFPFLFTLPIDRKTYIQEKYVFCVGGTVVSFAIAWMLYMASRCCTVFRICPVFCWKMRERSRSFWLYFSLPFR